MRRVVLIHGFGCDSRFWAPQVAALGGYEVCVPDLPYHGGLSDGVEKSLEGLAAWVRRECLSEPAVLVGHSLGGMITLQIVHERPELVEGIVLMDSFPSLELNARYLNGMYAEGMPAELREWIEMTREEIVGAMTRENYDAIWPSVWAFDARGWLDEIECPLLGIYGGRGRYGAADGERLKHDLLLDRVSGEVEIAVLESGGHFCNLEYPEATNEVLVRWLQSLAC